MGCGSSVNHHVINPERVDCSHFSFLKVIGKGGFGKVNAAIRLATNELCAIKRIPKRRVLDPSLATIIWVERDVMSRVESPFLLRMHLAFQDDNDLFIVMPLLRGGDLSYYLETIGPMPERMARFYLAEIALALEHLHSLKYVYRDLKPQNLLFHEDGHVSMSDYGLCMPLREEDKWQTQGGAGTLGYQAPEVLCGERYGYSCDFFSYGVTAYKLLTRQQPFGKTGDDFGRRLHLSRVSPEACDFIKRLLILDPNSRLGTRQGWEAVKKHAFFSGFDWERCAARDLPPPYVPSLKANQAHCSNRYSLIEHFEGPAKPLPPLSPQQQALFAGFEFNVEPNNIPWELSLRTMSEPI